jgi:hypothetical protein
MDPLSVTFGVAGLVSLFSTCLDVIDRVDSFKEFGFESELISSKFEADKTLLRRWARQVGIRDDGKLDPTHHESLDDPEIALRVENILVSIQKIFNKPETSLLELQSSLDTVQKRRFDLTGQVPKSSRLRWALKGKAKCIAQTQHFGALVQSLRDLVPVETRDRVRMHTHRMKHDALGMSL